MAPAARPGADWEATIDDFDRMVIRLDEAKNENRNAAMSGDEDRKARARAHYRGLLDEFSVLYAIHKERVDAYHQRTR